MMKDGFRTLINYNNVPAVNFAEVTISPPGWDGRGPIDISNMRNTSLVTKWPKSLIDVTDVELTVQWNTVFFGQVRPAPAAGLLNVNQPCWVKNPDGYFINFYGWAGRFKPQPQKEGEVPIADMTTHISNINPLGFETAPWITF